MSKIIFITGTGTGVGKTMVASVLVRMLDKDGFSVCPMKPVETGVCSDYEGDIDLLLRCVSPDADRKELSPYRLRLPASPHLAARDENVEIKPGVLRRSVDRLKGRFDYIIVEGCGGLMVPLNESGYLVSDWIKEMNFPVIMAASRAVGTINHTLLGVKFCQNENIKLAGIIFSDAHPPENSLIANDNMSIIKKLSAVPILGMIPFLESTNCEEVPETWINRDLFYILT